MYVDTKQDVFFDKYKGLGYWYAINNSVYESKETKDWGSYNFDDAASMLLDEEKNNTHPIISVIDETDNICIDEIAPSQLIKNAH